MVQGCLLFKFYSYSSESFPPGKSRTASGLEGSPLLSPFSPFFQPRLFIREILLFDKLLFRFARQAPRLF